MFETETVINKESSTTSDVRDHSKYSLTRQKNKQRTNNHNTVVQAMITSNNLRNCREVEEIVSQCINNKDHESFMCETALRYKGGCKN
mmetsp:Transcript_68636/g.76760  ORF Transcript_68636/g.76760 Transcript_68636/m.76760 type:complete len:88 (-) Transcript_68636:91-354(-)